jgi:hypothetical protein
VHSCDILGTTKITNLKENIGGAFVQLSPEEVDEISAAVPRDEVVGIRMDESMAKLGYVDTPPLDSYMAPQSNA